MPPLLARRPQTTKQTPMRPLLTLLLAVLLSACAKPAWMHAAAPDFSDWFDSENSIVVQEAARANVCGTPGGETVVTLMRDLPSMQAWSANRGIELVSLNGKPFPEVPYAIVEFGQRPNSGYGIAVSRMAGAKDGDLMLKATFFEPIPGRWSEAEVSSPCVIVALPAAEYSRVRLIDQTSLVRADTEGAP
jgi:hypothetical protein